MIDITVENIEETLWKLAKYNMEMTKEFDKIVRRYSRKVARDAKARAPVGPTGNLKASIRSRYFMKSGPASTVFPRGRKAGHRHLVEYGTRTRTQKRTKRKTGRMPARPFMKPAMDAAMPQYMADMQRLVEKDATL